MNSQKSGACLKPVSYTHLGRELGTRGTIEGIIGYEERGENGFGYDPIFFLPERGCSTAELPPEEKNNVSHRGNALRSMKALLEKEHLL